MSRPGPARRWSWLLLAGLLAALLSFALLTDAGTPGEREITHLMAAASLAWDGDLSYGREDYDRYVRTWEREPAAVALATRAGSSKVGFGRPSVFAVVAAPFVRVSPRRGPAVLNWLLLALAAAASALVLERAVGPWAPAWIALCVGGTTAFTLLPLPSPELIRLAASALAWALVVQIVPAARRAARRAARAAGSPSPIETNRRTVLRWSLVGSLLTLAVVASVDGFSLLPALGAAAWLALLQPRRRLAAGGLLVAALVTAAAFLGVAAAARGGVGPAERGVFDRATGFPAVDFEVEEWSRGAGPSAPAHSAGAAPGRPRFDARASEGLRLRTGLYALLGRTVGFLPYGIPLVFAALWVFAPQNARKPALRAGCRPDGRRTQFLRRSLKVGGWRRVLLVAAVGSVAVRAFLFPFDLGDERAALGPGPPPAGGLSRLLPGETTQRLGPAGPDLFVGAFWLRPVAGRITPFGEESILVGTTDRGSEDSRHSTDRGSEDRHHDGWLEFLIASENGAGDWGPGNGSPSAAGLQLVLEGSTRLEVLGAELQERRTLPSGRTAVDLRLAAPVARHRLWWSREAVAVHRLRLSVGGADDAPDSVHRLELRSQQEERTRPASAGDSVGASELDSRNEGRAGAVEAIAGRGRKRHEGRAGAAALRGGWRTLDPVAGRAGRLAAVELPRHPVRGR